jgi:pilus assembly protein CpaE
MTGAMKATVVLDDRVDRVLVETVLTSSRDLDVSDFLEMSGFDPDHGGADDVLIVACDDFTPLVGDYLGATSQRHPTRPVILLCTAGVNGHVGEAMGAGADDILTLPKAGDQAAAQALSSEVAFSVEKALARKRGTPVPSAQTLGRMICVLGLKGGSGKTLTAANLAVSLASNDRKVAVIDLDLQFGDIGLSLGLSPERTLYDLVRSGGSLDAEKLEDFLAVHPSGVRALLAPARPDQAGIVTPEFLKDVYRLLLQMHDYVIVDTPPAFTPEVIGAVDTSSEACVVSMLDSPSLKNSKLGIETLELMDYQGRLRVVLNRADSNVGITPEDVVAILGRKPDVLVPSDRNVVRSVNQGEPIALVHRRADAARAFRVLAELYLADEGRANGASPRGRRRLLRGRRGEA